MSNKGSLYLKCVLILGTEQTTISTIAGYLAAEGAIIYLSTPDKDTLRSQIQTLRNKVPGCSLSGVAANLESYDDLERFFVFAEVALPKHDALITLLDERMSNEQLMLAAEQLFTLMIKHQDGQLINVGPDENQVNDLSARMLDRVGRNGITVSELSCVDNDVVKDIISLFDKAKPQYLP